MHGNAGAGRRHLDLRVGARLGRLRISLIHLQQRSRLRLSAESAASKAILRMTVPANQTTPSPLHAARAADEHELRALAVERRVLLVEDDEAVAEALSLRLQSQGYHVVTAPTGRRAEILLHQHRPGVILLDVELPDSRDLALFHRLKATSPMTRIIFMTANDSLELVIGATRAGAFDFISKSSGGEFLERVVVTVRNAFEALAREEEVARLASTVRQRDRFARIISHSPQMEDVRAAIDKLASSKVNVLVTGPSGTGKEVVAHTIHEAGPRSREAFIAVNCAGIPDALLESELFGYERGAFTGAVGRKIGKFEAAHGGTLFLDEIGEMSLSLQAKLLRVLQDGRFERLGGNQVVQADARIVCATNRDLLTMVRQGAFREDLYYRIAVFQLELPPLAERRGDISLLVEHFVRQSAREERKAIKGVAPEVLRLFENYAWPGNVRQLQNVIARSAVVCNTEWIALRDLPETFVQDLQTVERSPNAGPDVLDFSTQRPQDRTPLPPLDTSLQVDKTLQTTGPVVGELAHGTAVQRLDLALRLAFPDPAVLPTAEELETAGIRLVMRRLGGNLQLTAKRLGLSRATLYRRLDGLGEAPPE